MLHLKNFFVRFEVLESDIVVLFEQFLECLLLFFVLLLELVELFGKLLVPLLEFLIDGLHFRNLLLLNSNLVFDLLFVLLFLFVKLGNKIF